jgi:hypothetical protein
VPKSPEFHFAITPSLLDEAFERARAELLASEAAASAEEVAGADDDPPADDFPERMIMGHELLLAVREPIEWLLALARRLASGDPDDVAAIDRMTAAFHSRLAGGGLGVLVSDALTAFGILIGALDPSIVVESATHAVAGGFATLLAIEGSALAAQLKRLADSVQTSVRGVCPSRGRGGRRARGHSL